MLDFSGFQIFLFFAVSLFGFIIRLPFAIWKSGIAGDNMGGFSKIYGLSKKAFIRYDIHDAANGGGYFPRPALFHYLVSRFPKKLWRITAVFLNIFFDILTGWLCFGMAAYFLEVNVDANENSFFGALMAMLVFYTSPILMPVTARLKATNNRTMGLFFATCYFLSLYLAGENAYFYIAIVLFAYLCIIGSTFSLQAILFFTPLLCLCIGNFIPLAVLFAGILVLWFLPFTGVKEILMFKWKHILMYNQNLKTSNSTKSRKLLINTFLLFFAPNGLSKKLRLFLYDAPLTILIYSVPFIPILFFLLVFSNPYIDGFSLDFFRIEFDGFCFAMLFSSCVLFIVTSIGKGKIFGESERYFEFGAPFLVALFINLCYEELYSFVFITIFFQLSIVVFIHFLSKTEAIPSLIYFKQDKNVDKIVSWLSANAPEANIATVPIRFSRALSSQQLYTDNVRCKFYYQMITPKQELKDGFKVYNQEVQNKNTFKISPQVLKARYGIEFIIVNDELQEKRNPDYLMHLNKLERIQITEQFSAYKID